MRYKKDMLLILAVVLTFGMFIQAARMDLISALSAEGRLLDRENDNYVINSGK